MALRTTSSVKAEAGSGGGADSAWAAVVISKQVVSGVRVGIGGRETVLTKPLAGPVRIEERKVKNVTEFVAVNPLTGSVTVLRSTQVDLAAILKQWEQAEQEVGTDKSDAASAAA